MNPTQSTSTSVWQDGGIAGHTIIHAALGELVTSSDSPHLSVEEASRELGLTQIETLKLIDKKILCADYDATTDSWLIDRQCVLAQQSDFLKVQHQNETASEEPSLSPEVEIVSAEDDHEHAGTESSHVLDMTPEVTAGEGLVVDQPERSMRYDKGGFASLSRKDTTAKNVEALLGTLDFANVRLEGAMYRIGYLESQVDSLQEQMKSVPEYRARAAKAILIERENDQLKEVIASHEKELSETHELLSRLQNSKLFKFCSWACGVKL